MNFYLEALQDEHLLLKSVLNDYRAQVDAVAQRIRKLLEEGAANRLLFCGMGSSLYAAYSVMADLNNGGVRAEALNCYETMRYASGRIDAKTILIAISQSGNTPEILRLMENTRESAALTVSMFNNEDCRLKGMADMEILLKIGRETHISNKTYYAQVAQLNLFAAAILGRDTVPVLSGILRAIDYHADFVAHQKENIEKITAFIGDADLVDLLGDDAQLGAALQAGLVLREMSLRNFCAHSLSDYNHGWFEVARPGYVMMILADALSENDRKMIDFCLSHGGKVALLSPEKPPFEDSRILHIALEDADRALLPLYSIVPCYFAAGALAADRG